MPRPHHVMDRYDYKILDELQRDGALSNLELAERIGLSASPCSRRVKALEDSGVIIGRRVIVDPLAVGLTLSAVLMVSLDRDTPERFERFEATVSRLPQIKQCLMVTGQAATYMVTLLVADMEEYKHVLLEHITQIDGVVGVQSSFVLRSVVDRSAVPVGATR